MADENESIDFEDAVVKKAKSLNSLAWTVHILPNTLLQQNSLVDLKPLLGEAEEESMGESESDNEPSDGDSSGGHEDGSGSESEAEEDDMELAEEDAAAEADPEAVASALREAAPKSGGRRVLVEHLERKYGNGKGEYLDGYDLDDEFIDDSELKHEALRRRQKASHDGPSKKARAAYALVSSKGTLVELDLSLSDNEETAGDADYLTYYENRRDPNAPNMGGHANAGGGSGSAGGSAQTGGGGSGGSERSMRNTFFTRLYARLERSGKLHKAFIKSTKLPGSRPAGSPAVVEDDPGKAPCPLHGSRSIDEAARLLSEQVATLTLAKTRGDGPLGRIPPELYSYIYEYLYQAHRSESKPMLVKDKRLRLEEILGHFEDSMQQLPKRIIGHFVKLWNSRLEELLKQLKEESRSVRASALMNESSPASQTALLADGSPAFPPLATTSSQPLPTAAEEMEDSASQSSASSRARQLKMLPSIAAIVRDIRDLVERLIHHLHAFERRNDVSMNLIDINRNACEIMLPCWPEAEPPLMDIPRLMRLFARNRMREREKLRADASPDSPSPGGDSAPRKRRKVVVTRGTSDAPSSLPPPLSVDPSAADSPL